MKKAGDILQTIYHAIERAGYWLYMGIVSLIVPIILIWFLLFFLPTQIQGCHP